MRFLILILLAYGTGLLMLRGPISAAATLPGAIIWLDVVISVLLATACGLILVRRSNGSAVSNSAAAATTLVTALTIMGFIQFAAGNLSSAPIAALATTSAAEAQIDRAWDGHFRAIAQIDNVDVGLMVDTGASIVLLRYDDAMRIGINPDTLDFSIPLTTAGGRTYVAPITFETIRIGDVLVYNVKGAIAQSGSLHSSLLGMSFIEKLSETVIRSDEMIFRQ